MFTADSVLNVILTVIFAVVVFVAVVVTVIPMCTCIYTFFEIGPLYRRFRFRLRDGFRTQVRPVVRPVATITPAVIFTRTKMDNSAANVTTPSSQTSSAYPTSGNPPQGYPATGYPQESTAACPPQQPGAHLPH